VLSILTQDYHSTEASGSVQTQALKYKVELEAEVNRRKDVEAELNDKKRELHGAKTDCTWLISLHQDGLVEELADKLLGSQ
jgi:hypothetical protein